MNNFRFKKWRLKAIQHIQNHLLGALLHHALADGVADAIAALIEARRHVPFYELEDDGREKFVADFVAAWAKVMDLDRPGRQLEPSVFVTRIFRIERIARMVNFVGSRRCRLKVWRANPLDSCNPRHGCHGS